MAWDERITRFVDGFFDAAQSAQVERLADLLDRNELDSTPALGSPGTGRSEHSRNTLASGLRRSATALANGR